MLEVIHLEYKTLKVKTLLSYKYLFLHRSCSGFIVTSYSKKEDVSRYSRKLDQQLRNLLDQYKIFKKNLDLKFELSESQELTGKV